MKSAERLSISLTIFGISTKMSYSNTPKVNNYHNIKKCPGPIPQKAAILNKFAFLEKYTRFYLLNPPDLESAQDFTIETVKKMNIGRNARNFTDL